MGGKGDERTVLKPIKPLAVRYNDNRRTLKYYKELLKMKSKRSRLLIMAIADKLNEKEMETIKIRQECDMKLSTIWQQLLHLQGNLNKEQVRLNQVLQDKENIIISQRQEIQRLRHALELAEKGSGMVTRSASGGSFRRLKRDRSLGSPGSSTEDSSSPGSSPKQRPQVTRSLSSEMTDSGLGQDAKNVNLSRQKLLKGSERPKLKQTNSNSSVTEETKGPKGILKSPNPVKGVISTAGVKPPVPSRNKVNEKLELRSEEVRLGAGPQRTASGSSSDSAGPRVSEARRVRGQGGLSRDSGNSSLDSSDPSSSMEWRLSVRSTIPILATNNNNGSSVERTPMMDKKAKPPPPPRRSKSYERPSIQGPDIQQNFEEYDLSTMDSDRAPGTSTRLKKVSFQGCEPPPGPLRRMPSQPNLTGLQQPPPVPARTMFLSPGQEPPTPTFSSFKGDQKLNGHKIPESSMIQKLDSSSVLSKLLSDSLVTGANDMRADNMAHIDENLNITNIRGDDKYYF